LFSIQAVLLKAFLESYNDGSVVSMILSKVTNCTLALKTSLAKNLSSKSEFHVTVQCN